MLKKEVLIFLPNPDVPRLPCEPECTGCEKAFDHGNDNFVCIAYANPSLLWKFYEAKEYERIEMGKTVKKIAHSLPCALASHMTHLEVPEGKKWVNPLKATKRRNR